MYVTGWKWSINAPVDLLKIEGAISDLNEVALLTQEYDWAIFHLTIGKKFLLLHKSNTGRQERIMPKITQKGQVTIPKKIRECMGLRLGSQVDFQICQGKRQDRNVIL